MRARRAMRRKITQKLRRIKFRSNFKIRNQIPLPFKFLSRPHAALGYGHIGQRPPLLIFSGLRSLLRFCSFCKFSYFVAAVSAPAAAVLAAALGFAAWRYTAAALFAELATLPALALLARLRRQSFAASRNGLTAPYLASLRRRICSHTPQTEPSSPATRE